MDRRVEIPGMSIALDERGTAEGWPTFCIHGWLDNAASFERLLPLLGLPRTLAVDLPGHGLSDHRGASAEYHHVDWVAAFHDIVSACSVDRLDIIGHSMGAGIGALYAGLFPDRVRRLVMLEGFGPFTTDPTEAVDNMRRALEARPRHRRREQRRYESVDAAIARRVETTGLSVDAARAIVTRGVRDVDGGVEFAHDPRLTARSLLRFTEEQVLAIFQRVVCPVLVLRAADGLSYPGDVAERRLEALAQVRVLDVEGGHHVHLEQPERVAPAIRAFLGET